MSSRPSSRQPTHSTALPASALRSAVERVSVGPLTRVSRLPRAVPFLVVLGLLVVGIVVGGPVGAGLLAVVVLLVGWLLYLSWPRLTTSERLGRTAVVLLAMAICLTQVFPSS